MDDSFKDLLELIECPVCFEQMYPPIFQCPKGHTLCSSCKRSIDNKCPTCRVEMGDIRSLAFEMVLSVMKLPCKHKRTGCTEVIRYEAKKQHEDNCIFRPYNCPFPCSPCDFTGDIAALLDHMRNIHDSTFNGNTCAIDTLCRLTDPYIGGNSASSNLTVYEYYGEHFCLHFEAFYSPQDLVFMIFLTYMGGEVDATDHRYILEIGNDTRKMTWQGVPRSIREGREQIRESCDGLVVHQTVAQRLSETNTPTELALRVKGRIWKEEFWISSTVSGYSTRDLRELYGQRP